MTDGGRSNSRWRPTTVLERLRALRLGLTAATLTMALLAALGLFESFLMRDDSVEVPIPGGASLCGLIDCPPLGEYEPPMMTCRASEVRDLGSYCVDALHEKFGNRRLRWIEMLDFTANATWVGAVGIGTLLLLERRQRRQSSAGSARPARADLRERLENAATDFDVRTDADGCVVIGARPGLRPTVDLRLRPEGLEVFLDDVGGVTLSWDDRADGPGFVHLRTNGTWDVGPYGYGRRQSWGLAVWVDPKVVHAAAPLLDATSSWWRRSIGRRAPDDSIPGQLAVEPSGSDTSFVGRVRDTLGALTLVLKERPDLRPRLADRERSRRLAQDLDTGSLNAAFPLDGVRGDTVDISVAMRTAGCVHKYGRPLWVGEPRPPLEHCVAEVKRLLEQNPYREGRAVDVERIEHLVRRYYLDVEPWPFGALVDDSVGGEHG